MKGGLCFPQSDPLSQSGLFLQSDPGSILPASALFLYAFPPGAQYSSIPINFSLTESFFSKTWGFLFCAMLGISQDEEIQFPYHHILHFLQLSGCLPHDILAHPLPFKWPHWVWCESLSFTLESLQFESSPFPIISATHHISWTKLCIFRTCIFNLFPSADYRSSTASKPHLWPIFVTIIF